MQLPKMAVVREESYMNHRFALVSISRMALRAVACLALMSLPASPVAAALIPYQISLSGANESPVNSSLGVGSGTVTIDTTLNTMTIVMSFSGLSGNTTAAHIHCCTVTAGTGTAGVATMTPSFTGFPLGVKSSSFSATYDLTVASSYNAAYITANGGTTGSAYTALSAGIAAGKAYFNIHTSVFGGGEIRAFLLPFPSLDVDNSVTVTRYNAFTDGLLILRYMQGLTGPALIAGTTLAAPATRITSGDIKSYLDGMRTSLDVDGDTLVDPATDGILILRYLLGLRGTALIQGAVTPGAPRSTATDIEAYLATLTPP